MENLLRGISPLFMLAAAVIAVSILYFEYRLQEEEDKGDD